MADYLRMRIYNDVRADLEADYPDRSRKDMKLMLVAGLGEEIYESSQVTVRDEIISEAGDVVWYLNALYIVLDPIDKRLYSALRPTISGNYTMVQLYLEMLGLIKRLERYRYTKDLKTSTECVLNKLIFMYDGLEDTLKQCDITLEEVWSYNRKKLEARKNEVLPE